jgi:hypothetical protein
VQMGIKLLRVGNGSSEGSGRHSRRTEESAFANAGFFDSSAFHSS